jgi:short-chain fatty acids transporter
VGIVIQFPLYSGIQALMVGAGLAVWLSGAFVGGSDAIAGALGISAGTTFPIATLASAGVVNFFVPSGGGQWIVQGPIMCQAADALGLPLAQTVMAVAYGDQLTNMVQPFWAIPLMGLTRVDARAFMGYCALLMLLATPLFVLALLLY